MKRALGIFAIVLVIAASTMVILYLLRKNKALQQYVHPHSQAVLSISLDDLLLDNIGQLFKRYPIDGAASTSNLLDANNWLETGVYIPAQIHFFTMEDNPFTFFTIQKIEHPQKWNAFVKKYLTDSINLLKHSKEQVSHARLSSNVVAMFDQQYLLLCFAAVNQNEDNSLQTIWDERNNWMYVHDLPFAIPETPPAHITYRHIDGTFQLFADITNNHIQLSGDWHLPTDTPITLQRRKPVINDPFLALWSTLPLEKTPFIIESLSIFSDLNSDKLIDNTGGYVDLYISDDMTTQRDTAIVYDYDEDFNSIEREEIQEINVPVIESAWKGNVELTTVLPEKLFYRFNKNATDSVILWTTKTETIFSPTFIATSSPFQIVVDFSRIPTSWTNDIFRLWQQQALQLTLETSLLKKHTLGITGSIQWK